MVNNTGKRIRELRDQKKLSQPQLLELARPYIPTNQVFARATLSRIENGWRRPNGWQLEAIARGLGKSVDFVMGINVEGEAGEEALAPAILALAQQINGLTPEERRPLLAIFESILEYGTGSQHSEGVGSRDKETAEILELLYKVPGDQRGPLVAEIRRRVTALSEEVDEQLAS